MNRLWSRRTNPPTTLRPPKTLRAAEETQASDNEPVTEAAPVVTDEAPAVAEEHPTEVMAVESTGTADTDPPQEEKPAERRFTAPSGFDSSTQKMETPPEPATEVLSVSDAPGSAAAAAATTGPIPASGNPAAPQVIPARRCAQTTREGGAAGVGWWR